MSLHLLVAPFIVDIGRALRESFFMFWETMWALVLGFTLSGAVQAFVSKQRMQEKLGTRSAASATRASFYGMVSSSCSYAASAMSKSLFAKGADFTNAMIFMVASTNLVIELALVLVVLLGWQFAAAEFVGGPIMIALLALAGGAVFTAPLVARARERLSGASHLHDAGTPMEEGGASGVAPWRTSEGWSDASSYAVADATMLRKELVIGYVVAGFIAALVPLSWWNGAFLHGHGVWTSVENVLVGPIIAVISWVCSVGNVPLAAALWAGGISFGGVVAFIFADLISMPLIIIYRKFYGGRLTLRLVGLFYVVMAVAGLATEFIFRALGAVPSHHVVAISSPHFTWNYTTYLNVAAILMAALVWSLSRRRGDGASLYAIDPVCKMQVRVADAPAHAMWHAKNVYFCSDRCRERFEREPERFDSTTSDSIASDGSEAPGEIDPVCGMTVDPQTAAAHRRYLDRDYWFCNPGCAERFDASPESFLGPVSTNDQPSPGPTRIMMSRKPSDGGDDA